MAAIVWRILFIALLLLINWLVVFSRLSTGRRLLAVVVSVGAWLSLLGAAVALRSTAWLERELVIVLELAGIPMAIALAVQVVWFLYFSKRSWQERRWRMGLIFLAAACVVAAVTVHSLQTGVVQEVAAGPEFQDEPAAKVQPNPGDWPWWRGLNHDNCAIETTIPSEWSATQNVVWKTKISGRGHSSPCVWNEHVFVTTADKKEKVQSVLAINREDGRKLWQTPLYRGPFDVKHAKNSYASASPACDGERVYVVLNNRQAVHLNAVDFEGNVVWQTKVGDFSAVEGYGASPAIYRSLVIVTGEGDWHPFVAAVDRASGKLVWRTRLRQEGRSFGTPIVATVAGIEQLLLATQESIVSLSPTSGEPQWSFRWGSGSAANTVAFHGDRIVATSTRDVRQVICVRADGAGDVTDTHVELRAKHGAGYVPSPLLDANHVFLVNDEGIAACLDPTNGKVVTRKRLGGAFSSSPVIADGRIYATNEAGTTYVLQADSSLEKLGENDIGQPVFASPVICGDRLYLRTAENLFCIGKTNDSDGEAEGHEAAGS